MHKKVALFEVAGTTGAAVSDEIGQTMGPADAAGLGGTAEVGALDDDGLLFLIRCSRFPGPFPSAQSFCVYYCLFGGSWRSDR